MKINQPSNPACFQFILLLLILLCFSGLAVSGSNGSEPECFHININKLGENKVVEVPLKTLCLEYEDRYGRADYIKLQILNWKNEIIQSANLPKSYGKNDFTIDLEDFGISDDNELYHLILENENRKKYTLSFRIPPPAEKPDPVVSIFVNPVLLECESPEGNLVEFYGSIEGGKAPYEIRWVLLNSNKSDLLYQPQEMQVKKAGYTPTIQVDKSPDYVVMLEVKDACGNEGKEIVNVQCKSNKNKANTVFIQPVPKTEDNFNK